MNRADRIIHESSQFDEVDDSFGEIEESFISYMDDRGGICVLEDGNWCFSDELEDLDWDELDEATVRKVRYGKNITVHTLTGSRKIAATKAGRKNIKSNLTTMKRKAHSLAAEKLRRKTMEKRGLWKRGGSTDRPASGSARPAVRPKSPMASRMKSRI